MKLKPIKTKKNMKLTGIGWMNFLIKKVKAASTEGEQLQVALLLMKQYEDEHYSVPTPDPIEAIKLKCQRKD